jgi:hypothetical protein
MKRNLDKVNEVTYKHAKFQYEIHYMLHQNIEYLNMIFCTFVG